MSAEATPAPRWRGRALEGASGAPLVQRLGDGAASLLQRSIRYHRPRAPFCGVGHCTGCLVRVNGQPSVRGCQYVPQPGDRITSENSWPSPKWDLLGAVDLLFPRGLDTLHGFLRPGFATPLYHRVIRRLAGYGRLPTPEPRTTAPEPPTSPIVTEVAVLGAGAAGRAAAGRLAEGGANVILIDRGAAAELPGVRLLPRSTAVFLPPPGGDPPTFSLLVREEAGPARLVRARRVIVATGGYDGPLLFANGDRPGVWTAEGALAMVPSGSTPPFRAAVLFGGSDRVLPLLERFGTQVEAIVAPGPVSPAAVERASALEVPIYPRTLLLAAEGRRRVRRVRLVPRGGSGPEFAVDADAVVLAHRRLPNPQLFYQAGARMRWDASLGAYLPDRRGVVDTTVPGLFGAGTAAGFLDPEASARSGLAAAEAALGRGQVDVVVPPVAESPGEMEGYYAEMLGRRRPSGKTLLCPCEDVLLSEVETAVRRGYRGVEVVKRYTGAGTGLCQGRYCLPDLLLVLAHLERRPPAEVGYITQRPPVVPTRLDALAALPPDISEEAARS